MMPDPLATRDLRAREEMWKWQFYLPTGSTRYILSYWATLTGTWSGFHHIQFMGFYSAWGKSVDIKGPVS